MLPFPQLPQPLEQFRVLCHSDFGRFCPSPTIRNMLHCELIGTPEFDAPHERAEQWQSRHFVLLETHLRRHGLMQRHSTQGTTVLRDKEIDFRGEIDNVILATLVTRENKNLLDAEKGKTCTSS